MRAQRSGTWSRLTKSLIRDDTVQTHGFQRFQFLLVLDGAAAVMCAAGQPGKNGLLLVWRWHAPVAAL